MTQTLSAVRRNVTVQTCLEIHLQSILYIDSQGQSEVLYLALIKSKHPQVGLGSIFSSRW